jgi:hypothetical protein
MSGAVDRAPLSRVDYDPQLGHFRSMSKVIRIAGWVVLATLIFATLAPIEFRPASTAPVSLDRFGSFALLGMLFALGYPQHRWQVLVLTLAAAGTLEALQMLSPSRHGRVADLVVKAAGGGFGVLAPVLATWLVTKETHR